MKIEWTLKRRIKARKKKSKTYFPPFDRKVQSDAYIEHIKSNYNIIYQDNHANILTFWG